MARYRKYTHSKIIKLTRQEIMLVEDEWYAKFNKNYNINTTTIG